MTIPSSVGEDEAEASCRACEFRSADREDVEAHIQEYISVQSGIFMRCQKCDFLGSEADIMGRNSPSIRSHRCFTISSQMAELADARSSFSWAQSRLS